MNELDFVKQMISTYLAAEQKPDGLYDLFEINNGNKRLLLGHIDTLIKIFNKAKEQLEKEIEISNVENNR